LAAVERRRNGCFWEHLKLLADGVESETKKLNTQHVEEIIGRCGRIGWSISHIPFQTLPGSTSARIQLMDWSSLSTEGRGFHVGQNVRQNSSLSSKGIPLKSLADFNELHHQKHCWKRVDCAPAWRCTLVNSVLVG
jgi:hypothetical protein